MRYKDLSGLEHEAAQTNKRMHIALPMGNNGVNGSDVLKMMGCVTKLRQQKNDCHQCRKS